MKILRTIISNLANLTPNVFYYSNETSVKINGKLSKIADDKKSSVMAVLSIGMINELYKSLPEDQVLELTLKGVTDNGVEFGDFIITAQRITKEKA